jgi:6-phosphofructokinase 1
MHLLGVEGVIGIGGDGTFAGLKALADQGFPTIGIPGTIDNDLEYTDFTIGFDTALNTACECINRVRETSDSHERASLITVMGRNCGDIAVHTALACGAEYVMVPEAPWSIEEIAERIKWGVLNGKRSTILVMAEGAFASLTSDVNAICAQHEELKDIATDTMTGFKLASIIEALSGQETRATVLGYIQRGGSPSAQDRILGSRFGARAVELLKEDTYGRAIGIRENRIIDVPFSEAVGHPQPLNRPLMDLVGILGK